MPYPTKIVFLTATIEYIINSLYFRKESGDIVYRIERIDKLINNEYFNLIDYSEHKGIKRLIEKKHRPYGHYSEIINEVSKLDIFNEGKKCLVFTERITTAEDMIKRFEKKGLKAINIFSQNSSKKDMNDEQNRIRNAIIERGIFIGDYDILIINGAYETGINILDERFEVCILDTEVNTKRTQSRARIRKDIEIAFYKDKDCKNYNIELNEKWLNRPLDTSEKKL